MLNVNVGHFSFSQIVWLPIVIFVPALAFNQGPYSLPLFTQQQAWLA